jgi:hypothetical protein
MPRRVVPLVGLLLIAMGLVTFGSLQRHYETASTALHFPTLKGLNYGVPLGRNGAWVGTTWLRSGTDTNDQWTDVRDQMAGDLAFVRQHHLGRVIRLFVALDQLIQWTDAGDFRGFDETGLANFTRVLSLFAEHDLKMVAVLYDQEVIASPGNFRIQTLDGHHPAMRDGYLRATRLFLQRFGSNPTIIAWDLFNEAYSSLGTDSNLPPPPAADPTSPGYSEETVHAFLRDLYLVAKQTAPQAWFTVSDATLYWKPRPDLRRYADVLDFYDVHVYDDHPTLIDLRGRFDKPFIVGEAGAAVAGHHFRDQTIEPGVVRTLLEAGQVAGALAVLVHSVADQNVFPASHDRLTPTGAVLSGFPDAAQASAIWPLVEKCDRLYHL